jgi:hypothetical protein
MPRLMESLEAPRRSPVDPFFHPEERSFGQWWRRRMSPGRAIMGLLRRIQSVPDALSWRMKSGPGSKNYMRLTRFKDIHAGERCFIMGNGPSLNQMDLTPLRHELTFGLNRIFLMFDRLPFQPTYYVSISEDMVSQSVDGIRSVQSPKFLGWRSRRRFPDRDDFIFILQRFRPRFMADLTQGLWIGYSVTVAALQIAYYMGVREAILIGVDHNFQLPGGKPFEMYRSRGIDSDHFDPEYFPKGFLWRMPDMLNSELAYQVVRHAYEADGRRVLDATLGGKLQVFPKVDYSSVV